MPDEGGTVHKLRYWRLCGNKVCGFEKGLVLPYSLGGSFATLAFLCPTPIKVSIGAHFKAGFSSQQ